MEIINFLVTTILASCILAATKYFLSRIDRAVLFRKRNYFYCGLIVVSIIVFILITTPIIRQDLNLIFCLLTIAISLFLGLFFYDFYRIHRRNNFSIKKYFTPLPKDIKKVSAVIPNYNYADFINERIDSIVNQKYPVYELIILDDCSSDNSVEVIEKRVEELKRTHPQLKTRIIVNEENSGNVFKQWAKAFQYSTGDYIWVCEADDLCTPYFLKQVMQAFEKDPEVVLSYAESDMVDENKKRLMANFKKWIDYNDTGHWKRSYINNGKNEISHYLAINNTVTNVSGVVFRNKSSIPYRRYLNSARKYRLAGDWYFYSKVLLHGKIAYNAESLNHYRSHTGSVSKTTDNFTHYKEIVSVQDSIQDDVKLPKKIQKLVQYRREKLQKQWRLSQEVLHYDKVDLEALCKKNKINDEVLLSIVIPVYNVEEYLPKCIESVLIDLPEKAEIILVNDGSTDNSGAVCDEYAKKDSRIIVVNQKNGGLSAARNTGLKMARGRYLAFIDSDDYVERNAYNTMLKMIIAEKADMVHCDIALYYDESHIEISKMENESHKKDQRLLRLMDVPLAPTCANKIYKKELLDGITFPVGKNNEDNAVVPVIVANCKKIAYIPVAFYNYVQRENSIQHKEFSEDRFVIFDTIKLCLSQINDKQKYEIISGTLVSQQILALLIWIIVEEKGEKGDEFIRLFCKNYCSLPISQNNRYIKAYLRRNKLPKLQALITSQETEPNTIRKYIRRGRTIAENRFLRRIF